MTPQNLNNPDMITPKQYELQVSYRSIIIKEVMEEQSKKNSFKNSMTTEMESRLLSTLSEQSLDVLDVDWKPVQYPTITNPHVLRIINQFRNTLQKKDLQQYGNLAIKQPMRLQGLKVFYIGTWKNNIPEGYGIFHYDSGIYFQGYILKGQLEGYGLLIMDNQQCFQGDFRNNRPFGKGTFKGYDIKAQGVFGVGEELIQGQIISYKKGTKTTMISKDVGVIESKNGMIYEGNILNLEFCGKCKITFPNGNTYEGGMLNAKFNGFGTYTWKQGFKFSGSYCNNQRQGWGKFSHTPILVQQCYWQKAMRTGNIKLYFKNQLIYTGMDLKKIYQLVEQYFYCA